MREHHQWRLSAGTTTASARHCSHSNSLTGFKHSLICMTSTPPEATRRGVQFDENLYEHSAPAYSNEDLGYEAATDSAPYSATLPMMQPAYEAFDASESGAAEYGRTFEPAASYAPQSPSSPVHVRSSPIAHDPQPTTALPSIASNRARPHKNDSAAFRNFAGLSAPPDAALPGGARGGKRQLPHQVTPASFLRHPDEVPARGPQNGPDKRETAFLPGFRRRRFPGGDRGGSADPAHPHAASSPMAAASPPPPAASRVHVPPMEEAQGCLPEGGGARPTLPVGAALPLLVNAVTEETGRRHRFGATSAARTRAPYHIIDHGPPLPTQRPFAEALQEVEHRSLEKAAQLRQQPPPPPSHVPPRPAGGLVPVVREDVPVYEPPKVGSLLRWDGGAPPGLTGRRGLRAGNAIIADGVPSRGGDAPAVRGKRRCGGAATMTTVGTAPETGDRAGGRTRGRRNYVADRSTSASIFG